jgi:hypothetical protein
LVRLCAKEGDVLRRVENVAVYYQRDFWGFLASKYRILIEVGRKRHLSQHRVTVEQFRAMEAASAQVPVAYPRQGNGHSGALMVAGI